MPNVRKSQNNTRRKGPRKIQYFILMLVGLTGFCALSLLYYRYPPFIARELARVTGKAGLLPPATPELVRFERSNWPQSAGVLPAATGRALTQTNEILRIDELRHRPAMLIEGATLNFDAKSPSRIVTSTLSLRNATIITNGADIEIEVETLTINNSEIRSFTLANSPPAQGPGKSAGSVRLTVHGRITGVLHVDLVGQSGAVGSPGLPGLRGTNGAKGAPAHSMHGDCFKPAGNGAQGGGGTNGGDGADGAHGGDGGRLVLKARNIQDAIRHIDFSAEPGAAGAEGAAGPGGAGGAGGPGGAPAGSCIGEGASGIAGANGAAGQPGKAGAAGAPGAMITQALGAL